MFDLFAYLIAYDTIRYEDGIATKVVVTTSQKHRHGRYATADLARWWAINANGVWHGGDQGPRLKFYPRHMICNWTIESVS